MDIKTPKTRSFIAINLPAKIKARLRQLMDDLQSKNTAADIRWVNPDGIHITLHFLRYLAAPQLKQVAKIIKYSIILPTNINLRLTTLDGFPNLKKPRILFVGCQEVGDNKLSNLRAAIGQALKQINLEADERSWSMHLTLARLNVPQTINVPIMKDETLNFTAHSVDLMKSELSRSGAKYSLIKKFNLK
ncbi:MAG: RNA 2',3'-cyclic phosphodiesterase [Candidatus Parcubacteria bacterium]|nr:RNA 2',3'-cyclic phosphodiesterase [Candidatus Parcubacteria bacterium]